MGEAPADQPPAPDLVQADHLGPRRVLPERRRCLTVDCLVRSVLTIVGSVLIQVPLKLLDIQTADMVEDV